MAQFYDLTPFTLLDYPGEMACVVWFAGCNMRCAFCHNPDIVLNKNVKDESELFAFLKKRVGLLTAVVFSGGEATLAPELPDLIRKTKAMGFRIKLDTNGSRPETLNQLLDENLLDYVALDYKCPPHKAEALVGTAKWHAPMRASLTRLIAAAEHGFKFEVRTTYHPDLMTAEDLNWMIEDLEKLGYAGTYYIQNIASHGDKTLGGIEKPSTDAAPLGLRKPAHFTVAFRNFDDEPLQRQT